METVRHAEPEYHAWFDANDKQKELEVIQNPEHVANTERCMIDGSWIHDALFSGYEWTWMNSMEITQLLGTRNQRRRISLLLSELEVLSWTMECML